MGYFEFCCRSGGSNLNSGTRKGDSVEPGTSPLFQYNNGNWDSTTGVFTVASGDPLADGVEVWDVASVYVTGAATTQRLAVVTAVSSTTITLSTTNGVLSLGTVTNNTANLRIGGAFAGPDTASGTSVPISLANASLLSANNEFMRINLKNDRTYTRTATLGGPAGSGITVQGYTNTYGDGGRALLSFSSSNYGWMTINQVQNNLVDLIFTATSLVGTNSGVGCSGVRCLFRRCTFANSRGNGLSASGGGAMIEECEFYNNGGNAGGSALSISNSTVCVNSIFANNIGPGANVSSSALAAFYGCIFANNGTSGLGSANTGTNHHPMTVMNCDFYNNAQHGIVFNNSVTVRHYIANCNFVKNGGFGLASAGSAVVIGNVTNCGFGRGSQVNVSGDVQPSANLRMLDVFNSVNYPDDVTPWVDPAGGDFRVNLAQAKQAGRGFFMQSQGGLSGTIGYPDIGAAQAIESGGSSSSARQVNIRGGADQ